MNTLSQLDNFTLPQLKELAEQYPFSAIIQSALAKKQLANQEQADEQITRAAIRLPKRKILQQYLNVDANFSLLKNSSIKRELDAPIEQEPEVEEQQLSATDFKAETVDTNAEVGEQQFEQTEGSNLQENDQKEVVVKSEEMPSEPKVEELPEKEVVINQKQETTFHGFDDDLVEPISKTLVDKDQLVEDTDHEVQKGSNQQKVKPEQELDYTDYEVRLGLEDLDDDDVHHIGNELVEEDADESISASHESEETKSLDEEFDEELNNLYAQAAYEASMIQKGSEVEEDVSETEEAEIEEAKDHSISENEEHNFMEWLSILGGQAVEIAKPDQPKEQKQVEETEPKLTSTLSEKQKADEDQTIISREVENQYRDAQEDLEDEQTREVQRLAKKSMTKNTSFYTETLANIYVKQEKWENAIEVYEALSIKFPEKSRYFANQIETLKDKL